MRKISKLHPKKTHGLIPICVKVKHCSFLMLIHVSFHMIVQYINYPYVPLVKSLACQGERKTRRLGDLLKDPEDIQWGASWQGKYLTPSNTDMKCLVVAVQYIFYMGVSQNGGTQQPLVFPLTMIILGWRLGVPPFKKHPYTVDCTLLHIYQTRSIESSTTSQAW